MIKIMSYLFLFKKFERGGAYELSKVETNAHNVIIRGKVATANNM